MKRIGHAMFRRRRTEATAPAGREPGAKPAASHGGHAPRQHDAQHPHRPHQPRAAGEPATQHTRHPQHASEPPWTPARFQVPAKEGAMRFHDAGLPDKIMHAIADLGFKYCTPIQAKILVHASAGQNVAGRAQTGTGKTAAFLISVFSDFLKRPRAAGGPRGAPRALVLAPTRELVIQIAKDATDLGRYCDFNCMAVYGGADMEKQKSLLRGRPVDLIAATPGRLLDFMGRGGIDLKHLEVLIIDEADRMLDMGFIPDVKRIIRCTPPKDKRRTMLFSATLTDDVLRLAAQWMPDPVICEIEPEKVAVDTVDQVVYIVTAREKFRLLFNILRKRPQERVLIFGNRRDHTQHLALRLRQHGIPCELLSGDVPQERRMRILEEFRDGRVKIVVATDVAGRGLHVKDIGLVVNYEFPYEPEDYVHRIGRTGRAGVAGTSISFACEEESFVIPEIEKYIGNPLKCVMPDEELLASPGPGYRDEAHEPRAHHGGRFGRQGGGYRGHAGNRPFKGRGPGRRR